jgi:2-haloacid dehalogenase
MSDVSVYVFDAYGTLFDVHAAVARHRDEIGPQADRLSELWRSKQLEYTWTRTLMGAYLDFATLTEMSLDFAAQRCGGLAPSLRMKLLEAYRTLDAYPDVAPTLAALRAKGFATAILSNGTPALLQAAMTSAGLAGLIDACLSVDEIMTYKTAPEAYRMVLERFDIRPGQVSFQSSNRWDIAGGQRFGFHTVWVNRTGQPDEYPDLPAGRIVTTLSAIAN